MEIGLIWYFILCFIGFVYTNSSVDKLKHQALHEYIENNIWQ